MKLLISLLVSIVSISAFSQGKIVIPRGTQMKYDQFDQKNNKQFLKGNLPLEGLLRIYWARTYRNDNNPNEKELVWYFVPDAAGQKKLPYLKDVYNKPNKLIRLSLPLPPIPTLDNPDENYLHERIKDLFPQAPENFWKYQEGFIEEAVALEFDYTNIFIECDRRLYEARISWRFHSVTDTDAVFPESLGGLSINLEDGYEVQSKTGFANLYSQPRINTDSIILSRLPNGAVLINLGSVNDQWFYGQLVDYDKRKPVLKGYIQKSQVTPHSP